nr:venom acid phosphatase Acph-1-like [Onthophagus taurus]
MELKRVFLILILIYFGICEEIGENLNENELILVEILFRHGARTTYKFYPTDPHRNKSFYPYGLGGLTNEGKLGVYNLGLALKSTYDSFLGNFYHEDLIELRSTHFTRTQSSGLLVLAGMFPPNSEEKWHPTLNWQPIPIVVKPKDEEDLLSATVCPYKSKMWNNLPSIQEVQEKFITPYMETFKYIEKHSKFQIRNPHDAIEMYFILSTESEQNLTLPDWTKSIYPEPLTSIASQVYGYWSYGEDLKKINIGYFLKKILNDFDQKINATLKPKSRKMFLYSGHESTLGYALDGLNLFDSKPYIPPYASAIIFELTKNNKGNHFVSVKYLNDEIKTLKIPNCGINCPIEKFKELYKDLIPDIDFKTMCNKDVFT